ncbi:MAG: polysaccharide deacetylase family protein [Pseudobacter sp.]|uniref:polysaccharide deacetylase family protein n=1 Tax=Pseudobacter sp. TaxID=2045420 RepID=UPI003F80741D
MMTPRIILVFCLFFLMLQQLVAQQFVHGAIVRGDTAQRKMAIVFTADEFGDGAEIITETLQKQKVKASFFFTGRFYRNKSFTKAIRQLKLDGHYLGGHSDKHLLYNDWTRRDSTLVTRHQFRKDLQRNYAAMKKFGISKLTAHYFLPPYEWYNQEIADWTSAEGLQLINFTHGTLSNADYTTPEMKNYRSSEVILQSIMQYDTSGTAGLNGFILLVHFGTDPKRTDKLYHRLPELIAYLKNKGYALVRVDQLGLPSLL